MRRILLVVLVLFFTGSVTIAQVEHFKQGYTTKNYDTLGTYYKMVSWDDSQYEQFTYFTTATNTPGPVLDFMNYRLMFPNNYDPSGNTKYPMIVMLHGAGESGRSWAGHYKFEPGDIEYDNNGKSILHGGKPHRDAVNRDPSDSRAFPGFILFPQVQNNGNWEGGWDDGDLSPRNAKAVKIIENTIDNFNINGNKIYVHGLSNGAKGVWDIVAKRPDLFAAFLPMSGVGREMAIQTNILTTMPLWLFQGGKDKNPLPNAAQNWVDAITDLGGRPRYYLYPSLGHGTWNTAYAESDFFSWMLEKDKRDIYVFGGSGETELCAGGQLTLGFSEGFLAYQWTKDGIDISGATTTRLLVNETATYAMKYQRLNGADSLVWDASFDLEITPKLESTFEPPVLVKGSLALPTPHSSELKLTGPVGYSLYSWYLDDVFQSSTSSNEYVIVPSYSTGNDVALAGNYTLSVLEPSGCESLKSDPIIVSHGNGLDAPLAPSNVTATTVSASEIDVVWDDNSNNEEYFEIWRGIWPSTGGFLGWSLLTIINENSVSFNDSGLLPETQYGYKIRSVNFDGGNIAGGSNASKATTLADLIAPSAPDNLIATGIGADTIGIVWDEAIDNIAIARYNIYIDGDSVGNTTSIEYVLNNLQPLTSYNISVRAVDFSENKSSFATGLWITTKEADPGLIYNIYDGEWNNLPDFTILTPTSTGVISTFDISERQGTDRYGYVFEGFIDIGTSGTYTFYTTSDDGSDLYIENTKVVANDYLQGMTRRSGDYVFSNPGKYAIKVEFFERTGGDGLIVEYEGADTGNSTIDIPSSVLFQNKGPEYFMYYSKSSGDLESVNSWGSNTNGNGAKPSNFSDNNQKFIIANRTTSTLTNSWSVSGVGSKVIVSSGETLSLDAQLSGMVEVEDNAILNMNDIGVPSIGDCGPSSIVNVNINAIIPNGNYGNLNVLNGQGTLNTSTTYVKGDLSVDASATMKGASNNESELHISGDITFNSSLLSMVPSEYFTLDFRGAGAHVLNVPSEDVSFYEIKTDFGALVTLENNTASPTSLNLGSDVGGGLILQSNSSLILNDVSLNIVGNGAINSGIESGVVSINDADISVTSNTTLNSNLYLDNTNKLVGDLTLNLTGNGGLTLFNGLDISNRLKVVDGSLNVNNNLTLLGSSSFTAYIDVIENGGEIIGDMIMQRHIREGRYWRYFSSPFSGATVADWQQTMPITGNFTGASVIEGVTSSASLYYFDETVGFDDAGWVVYPPNGGDNTVPIVSGVGYAMFVRADNAQSLMFDMSGNPHQGDFNFSLTPDPSASEADGWNLIGNPYASAIAWDDDGSGWSTSGINDIIYVRDNEGSGWLSWDRGSGLGSLPNGEVAHGQAFYVRATSSTPSVIISETAKSSNQPSFYRTSAPQNYLSIYLHSNDLSDVAYVIIREENNDIFENEYDGVKKQNSIFNLSTLSSDSIELAYNKMSYDFCSKSIALNIKDAAPGDYILDIENLESFDIPINAKLIDKFDSVELDLNLTSSYTFTITDDEASFGNDRFLIVLDVPEVNELTEIQGVNSCDNTAPFITMEGTDPLTVYQVYQDDIPVSEVIYGSDQSIDIKIDSTLIDHGTLSFTVKGWYESCGEKVLVGNTIVNYYKPLSNLAEVQSQNSCDGSAPYVTMVSTDSLAFYQVYQDNIPVSEVIVGSSQSIYVKIDSSLIEYGTQNLTIMGWYEACGNKKILGDISVDYYYPQAEVTIENDLLVSGNLSGNQWLLNGEIINGATGTTHNPLESGEYTVLVTEGVCSIESMPVVFVVTGLERSFQTGALNIYPNPANTYINISFDIPERDGVKLIIFNSKGQIVSDRNIMSKDVRLYIQNYPKGLYMIHLVSETNVLVGRFMKE